MAGKDPPGCLTGQGSAVASGPVCGQTPTTDFAIAPLVRPRNIMSTTSVLQLTYHYSANQNLARFPDTKLRTLVSKNEKVVWQPQRSIMSAPKSGLYVRCCRHLNRSNRWTPFFLVASRHRHAPSFVTGLSDGVDKSMQSHGMVEVGNLGSSVGRSPD